MIRTTIACLVILVIIHLLKYRLPPGPIRLALLTWLAWHYAEWIVGMPRSGYRK